MQQDLSPAEEGRGKVEKSRGRKGHYILTSQWVVAFLVVLEAVVLMVLKDHP